MSVQGILTGIQNDTAKMYAAQSNKGSSSLDQDAFLRLLMTQLQCQDPLNPVDNTAFIAQQAQLSTLSEMQSLNSSNKILEISNLIGKEVTVKAPNSSNTNNTVTGTVSEAKFLADGSACVVVNNVDYKISNITNIK